MKNMKVGILGSGDVGKSFAHAFGSLGHAVTIGSQSPEKLREFVSGEGGRVSAGTFVENCHKPRPFTSSQQPGLMTVVAWPRRNDRIE
jgi:predicted dehydrogenase